VHAKPVDINRWFGFQRALESGDCEETKPLFPIHLYSLCPKLFAIVKIFTTLFNHSPYLKILYTFFVCELLHHQSYLKRYLFDILHIALIF
jgi:hypothetical protein